MAGVAESDVFAEFKRKREDWDDAMSTSDRMDGAFLSTVCPDCGRSVSALIRDEDHPYVGLACPQCRFGTGDTEWLERVA